MAREEDKRFDAVLGGFLVNDLRGSGGHVHCPGSDVLAAYHERSLRPEEMNSWKEHIIGCARCQAVLAELQATDSIPLQAAEEAVLAGATSHVAEKVGAQEPAPVSFPRKSRSPRRVRWPWLAPAGALAAGLLVWIAWNYYQPQRLKTALEVKTASPEPPALSAQQPPAARQAPASPAPEPSRHDPSAALSREQRAANGVASFEKLPVGENSSQPEKPAGHAKAVPAVPSARTQTGRGGVAANPSPSQAAEQSGASLARAAAEAVEVPTPAADARTQNVPARANQLSEQKAALSGAPGTAQPAEKSKSESPALAYRAAATPAPAQAPSFSDVSASQASMARALSLNLIATPDKKNLWRVGGVGMIEFSSDGGASWSRQNSNVLVDLSSGFAPSGKVCWVVGRSGTILLTVDGGVHWSTVHSPLEEDVGGVRASDALHATVWNLGKTKVFETSDGGATWKPATSP